MYHVSTHLHIALVILFSLPRPSLGSPPEPALPHTNFPDPSIIWAEGKWWAFATGDVDVHFQVASAADYHGHWSLEYNEDGSQFDALPNLPSWVNQTAPQPWAPNVVVLDDGSYLFYYSAAKQGDNPVNITHCVSAAKSDNIRGPYTVVVDVLVCPGDSYGAIDVAGFKDWDTKGDWTLPSGYWGHGGHGWKESGGRMPKCNSKSSKGWRSSCGNSYLDPQWSEGGKGGKRYIVYKWQNADLSEDIHVTHTPLTLQEVDANDGVTLIGDPVRLLDNDGAGDDNSIEGPVIFKSADAQKYYLFFSKGNTVLPEYTSSYAVADSLTGPYVRKGDILKTGDFGGLNAPGGADISWNGQQFAFHAIDAPIGAPYNMVRVMYAGDVSIKDGSVKVVDI